MRDAILIVVGVAWLVLAFALSVAHAYERGTRRGIRDGYEAGREDGAEGRVADVEAAFARGQRVGADDLVDQMIAAELRKEDAIEVEWPKAGRKDRRPS